MVDFSPSFVVVVIVKSVDIPTNSLLLLEVGDMTKILYHDMSNFISR